MTKDNLVTKVTMGCSYVIVMRENGSRCYNNYNITQASLDRLSHALSNNPEFRTFTRVAKIPGSDHTYIDYVNYVRRDMGTIDSGGNWTGELKATGVSYNEVNNTTKVHFEYDGLFDYFTMGDMDTKRIVTICL